MILYINRAEKYKVNVNINNEGRLRVCYVLMTGGVDRHLAERH